ncbi:hypothetical protein PFZ49_01100 [Microbacterium lacticum]|uniref:hypothetical protein n=1 Tax=Microbacterium lacticum TaxID=33885 RepID=UPI003A88B148
MNDNTNPPAFRRFVAALALSVLVFLTYPLLTLVLSPVTSWLYEYAFGIPLLGWLVETVWSILPLALAALALALIWLRASDRLRWALAGLPGFRKGLSREDWKDLSPVERRAARSMIGRSRHLVDSAGLAHRAQDGMLWHPSISGLAITPSGLQFSVGGVPGQHSEAIAAHAPHLAAAIPGSEPVEVVDLSDPRYAVLVLRTRDPLARVDGLDLGHVEKRDPGSLDDFLGMEDGV